MELNRFLHRLLELDVQRGTVTSEDVVGAKLFPIIKAMEECYGTGEPTSQEKTRLGQEDKAR